MVRTGGAVRLLASELGRVDFLDRSMALGAQALLAALPLLIVVSAFSPTWFGAALLGQLADVVGLTEQGVAPLREDPAVDVRVETGVVGALVVLLSATSFAKALQRMYSRVWELPVHRGVRAYRGGLVWLVGWLAALQAAMAVVGMVGDWPLGGVFSAGTRLVLSLLIWWWSAHLLLDGRLTWRRLFPQAVATAVGVVALTELSALVMPRFARSNVEEFGLLGLVFSTASWLVCFGGVLVVSAVVGRLLTRDQGRLVSHASVATPSGTGASSLPSRKA